MRRESHQHRAFKVMLKAPGSKRVWARSCVDLIIIWLENAARVLKIPEFGMLLADCGEPCVEHTRNLSPVGRVCMASYGYGSVAHGSWRGSACEWRVHGVLGLALHDVESDSS